MCVCMCECECECVCVCNIRDFNLTLIAVTTYYEKLAEAVHTIFTTANKLTVTVEMFNLYTMLSGIHTNFEKLLKR